MKIGSTVRQGLNIVTPFKRKNRFDTGLGALLPESYKKFWREWKIQQPAAVHYIPKEGMFERDDLTGLVNPIQNIPLPLTSVPEENDGIWGGEAVIKGFQKRNPCKRRVPHFWVPVLRRSAVRSDILNEFFSVTVTDRTIDLIHGNHGFDHYILKTPACDLRSLLALGMKRRMLEELKAGCPKLANNPEKQRRILDEYKKYAENYTSEDIEWYGLSFNDAIKKIKKQMEAENVVVPHKVLFRSKLIEQLQEAGIREASEGLEPQPDDSWMSRMNIFGKKKET